MYILVSRIRLFPNHYFFPDWNKHRTLWKILTIILQTRLQMNSNCFNVVIREERALEIVLNMWNLTNGEIHSTFFPLFADFICIFHVSSRSGTLFSRFPYYFKNSRLWCSTIIILSNSVWRIIEGLYNNSLLLGHNLFLPWSSLFSSMFASRNPSCPWLSI